MASRFLAFLLALACTLTAQPVLARPACPRATAGCKHCAKSPSAPVVKCDCCRAAAPACAAARQAPQALPELELPASPFGDLPPAAVRWSYLPALPLQRASRWRVAEAAPRPPPLQRNRLLLN